jgi:P27 family predicted phage terminase small subunit
MAGQATKEYEAKFPPPRALNLVARQVWDRHAERIHGEGRWQHIDQELLAVFCETIELYLQFKSDVETHGTLVQGRTLQEKVRNPSLMGLAQCRADLVRLARAIPLVDAKPDRDGADMDAFIDELMAE